MDRAQKEAFVSDLNKQLQDVELVVVSHNTGLTVGEMTQLRNQMRENDANIRVAKNRLAKRAIEGTPFATIEDFLTGPTTLSTSADPVAAARVAHTFAKEHEKFIILGGSLGDKRLEAEDVKALASLPSLDELRGQLVGLISTPARQLATLTQESPASLARLIAQKPDAA